MKTILAAALLTTIGAAAALAQGAPPGSPSWKTAAWYSGPSGSAASTEAPGAKAGATDRDSRLAEARTEKAIPVASALPSQYPWA
jgi:hypothetical protein